MDKQWHPKEHKENTQKSNEPKFSKRIEDAPVIEHEKVSEESFYDDEPSSNNKAKYVAVIAVGVIVLILVVFFGSRAMTGYSVYSEMKKEGVPGEYATSMVELSNDLKLTQNSLAQAEARITEIENELASEKQRSDSEKAALQSEKTLLERTRDELKADISTQNARIKNLESNLDETREALDEAARRLCCVQRAFDDAITHFNVEGDGKVTCSATGTQLSC